MPLHRVGGWGVVVYVPSACYVNNIGNSVMLVHLEGIYFTILWGSKINAFYVC